MLASDPVQEDVRELPSLAEEPEGMSFMTSITHEIHVYSENGDPEHPGDMRLSMNGSNPDCPITFFRDGKPVFSLGADEVDDFCKLLQSLVP